VGGCQNEEYEASREDGGSRQGARNLRSFYFSTFGKLIILLILRRMLHLAIRKRPRYDESRPSGPNTRAGDNYLSEKTLYELDRIHGTHSGKDSQWDADGIKEWSVGVVECVDDVDERYVKRSRTNA